MRLLRALVLIGVLVAFGAPADGVKAQRSPIEGVWRIVEQTINQQTLKDGQLGAGYHMYFDGHFAAIRESGMAPRLNDANVDMSSVKNVLAVYGPFVAQFGTYVISGDVITETVLVSKNPSNHGRSESRRFRIEGNALITEPVEKPEPGARVIVLKFVRVE